MSSQISGSRQIGRSDMRPAQVFLIFAIGITLGFFVCKIYVQPYINSQKSSATAPQVATPAENSSPVSELPVIASKDTASIRE